MKYVIVTISCLMVSACDEEAIPESEIIVVSEFVPDYMPDSNSEVLVCTTHIQPGISISVIDMQTGDSLTCEASATVQEGVFTELLEPFTWACDSQGLEGAYERPGTYEIRVTRPGCSDAVIVDVPVTSGACHVNTTELEAYMSCRDS